MYFSNNFQMEKCCFYLEIIFYRGVQRSDRELCYIVQRQSHEALYQPKKSAYGELQCFKNS